MRSSLSAAILAALLAVPSSLLAQTPAATAAAAVPRVRLVATGGTISNKTGGRLTAEELVKSMPGIERYAKPEFDIASVAKLPRVDVILVYQGADGDLIKAAADAGAEGIIIAGAGAGATSGTQPDGIDYATKKGAFVVTTTRAGAGRIAAGRGGRGRGGADGPPPEARRRIAGEDLAPVKARVLLMLALTRTSDPAETQRMFTEY